MGDRRRGGEISAFRRRNERGERVYVNAAHLTGVQIDISVADAREFALRLLALLGDTPD